MEKLLSCPFCGGEAFIEEFTEPDFRGGLIRQYACRCKKCITRTLAFSKPSEAIDFWNTRPESRERLDENTLILAAQKFCRETYDTSGEKEEYHEKFGVLICFIKDVLIQRKQALIDWMNGHIKLCEELTCDKGKTLKKGTCEVINCEICSGFGFIIDKNK